MTLNLGQRMYTQQMLVFFIATQKLVAIRSMSLFPNCTLTFTDPMTGLVTQKSGISGKHLKMWNPSGRMISKTFIRANNPNFSQEVLIVSSIENCFSGVKVCLNDVGSLFFII
jgi:hypothetical protein